jgi:hypothetical protein
LDAMTEHKIICLLAAIEAPASRTNPCQRSACPFVTSPSLSFSHPISPFFLVPVTLTVYPQAYHAMLFPRLFGWLASLLIALSSLPVVVATGPAGTFERIGSLYQTYRIAVATWGEARGRLWQASLICRARQCLPQYGNILYLLQYTQYDMKNPILHQYDMESLHIG